MEFKELFKVPVTIEIKNGKKIVSDVPKEWTRTQTKNAKDSFGILTGKVNGIVVIDIDVKNGVAVGKDYIENIIGKKIVYWPETYNSSFQYVTEEMHSWIHRDATQWSAVVYMTPNAPCNGGTNLYKHKELQIEYDKDAKNDNDIKTLNDDSRNYDKWELVDSVGNKFNRCILFKGKRSHQSGVYFGKNKETARLFQTFFFDT